LLRKTLCKADYTKMELGKLHGRIARNEELIASYFEENMKLKQELFSLQERLLRHEEQGEQLLKVVEQLRRIVEEQPSPAGKEDEVTVINQIKDILAEVRQLQGDIRKPASDPGYFNRKDDKSDYVLIRREADQVGSVRTGVVKGICVPTAGGGTAVVLKRVELVSP
uniref:MKLP1_Arf_bdg domain-containing protein n=1 Tax=Angiostrongylus cantonensis TaxID=6313 RepID=A0A0K0D5R4_ANGCA